MILSILYCQFGEVIIKKIFLTLFPDIRVIYSNCGNFRKFGIIIKSLKKKTKDIQSKVEEKRAPKKLERLVDGQR